MFYWTIFTFQNWEVFIDQVSAHIAVIIKTLFPGLDYSEQLNLFSSWLRIKEPNPKIQSQF